MGTVLEGGKQNTWERGRFEGVQNLLFRVFCVQELAHRRPLILSFLTCECVKHGTSYSTEEKHANFLFIDWLQTLSLQYVMVTCLTHEDGVRGKRRWVVWCRGGGGGGTN